MTQAIAGGGGGSSGTASSQGGGGGAIIGLNRSEALNPVARSTLETLYNQLHGQFQPYFVINGYGEAVGPSSARPWTITGSGSVAQFVQSGGVFVTYCGWPLYASVSAGGLRTEHYAAGFQTFARAIGYDWLGKATFNPPDSQFHYIRGLNLSGSEAGLYLPYGDVNNRPITSGGATAMFALHHAGIGWFFYACDLPSIAATLGDLRHPGQVNYVPVDIYAHFIQAVIQGKQRTVDGLAIKHVPYQGPIPQSPGKTDYPTTPYGGNQPGPGGGSSGKKSSGSPSSGSNGSGTSGATAPKWVKPAGIALASAGGIALLAHGLIAGGAFGLGHTARRTS